MTVTTFFDSKFGTKPEIDRFVPGRVNLIGEHIDYNGGRVLPFALETGVSIALSRTKDPVITIVSDRFDGVIEMPLTGDMSEGWARYVFFTARLAQREGWFTGGLNIAISSNLDDGAGLSSSAAICVAVLKSLRDLCGVEIDNTEIAKLARRVENEDIGMPCGIMDQMAVAVAQPGQAIFLDTETLEYDAISLPNTHRFVVLHSGIRRELADGRYKARKEECDEAKAFFGTNDLCHLDLTEVQNASSLPENVRRRVVHCVTEHQRTVDAAKALKAERLHDFGALMDESHSSMRSDFEMTVPGIDDLVAVAKEEGAIGARLTGGGFGGCIVACVDANEADPWVQRVLARVPDAFRVC